MPERAANDERGSRARRLAAGGLAGLALALAVWAIATCALSRAVHEARYGHDIFLPLDAAWRTLSGQTQHVDFYSPYGPIETSLVAWTMRIGGAGVLAVPRAIAVVGLIAALGALAVALGRVSRVVGAWVVSMAALVAVGREQLGFPFFEVSHGAYYNRIGFALLVAIMVECLVAPRGERRATVVAGGAVSGFFTAILVFVKLTFPLVAGVFLAMSAVLLPRSRARLLAIGAGALAGLVAGGALIGFRYGAMLGDYAFIAAARRMFVFSRLGFLHDTFARDSPVLTAGRIVETIVNEAWPSLFVAGMAAIVPLGAFRLPERKQVAVLVVLTWCASMLLVFTSWQWGGSPLFAVLALVLAEHALRSETRDWRCGACLVLCAACVGDFAFKEAVSVLYDETWQASYEPEMDTFPGLDPAKGLVIDGSDSACQPRDYGARIRKAIDAIAEVPDPRVVALDFSNPFSFLMRSRPPEGGGICWHYESTFSEDVHLSPEAMFGDANVVVVPRCPEDPGAAAMLAQLYDETLRRNFSTLRDTGALLVLRKGH